MIVMEKDKYMEMSCKNHGIKQIKESLGESEIDREEADLIRQINELANEDDVGSKELKRMRELILGVEANKSDSQS
jgi:hypothetical protein